MLLLFLAGGILDSSSLAGVSPSTQSRCSCGAIRASTLPGPRLCCGSSAITCPPAPGIVWAPAASHGTTSWNHPLLMNHRCTSSTVWDRSPIVRPILSPVLLRLILSLNEVVFSNDQVLYQGHPNQHQLQC